MSPEAFADLDLDIDRIVKRLYSKACAFAHSELLNNSLIDVYESIEWQYINNFWNLVASIKAYVKINPDEIGELLRRHSLCIANVMSHFGMVQKFDHQIRAALLENVEAAVSIIVGHFGANGPSNEKIYLPPSLTGIDIDEIVLKYLSENNPNANYVQVLMNWPNAATKDYRPSIEVRIKAKRRYEELNEQFLMKLKALNTELNLQLAAPRLHAKIPIWMEIP